MTQSMSEKYAVGFSQAQKGNMQSRLKSTCFAFSTSLCLSFYHFCQNVVLEMASQTVAESVEQFRAGDGDGEEEEDGEETLDPRVKVRLQFTSHTCLWCGATPCKCIIHLFSSSFYQQKPI